jgi:hypothetical protein
MARPNDYSPGNSPNASSNGTDAEDEGTSVAKLRRQYMDFLGAKDAEISEQRLHRHYYHGDQLTKDQLQTLRDRGQPATIRDKASAQDQRRRRPP